MTTNINHHTSPISHRHVSTNILISLNQKKKSYNKIDTCPTLLSFLYYSGPHTLATRFPDFASQVRVTWGTHFFNF